MCGRHCGETIYISGHRRTWTEKKIEIIMNMTFISDDEAKTSACQTYTESTTGKITKTLAYCIMLLLALSGNTLLVCVVYSQRKLRTTTNFLISNMAISDLMVPVFAMPRTIVEIHLGHRRWLLTGTLGLALCKVIYFLQDVSTAVSVLSLSCITIDRFYAVVRPQYSTPIKGRVKAVIAGIWVTAMLLHSPYFYTFQLYMPEQDIVYCILMWPKTVDPEVATKIFFLTLIILLYFIPLVLITALQWFIVKKLRKQRLPYFSSSFRQRKRGRRNRKVVHFTLAVIITFFTCWTPTVVYTFIVMFRGHVLCVPEFVRFASMFLVQSNSSLNFFIYFIFNENYRKSFKKMFCAHNALLRLLRRAGSSFRSVSKQPGITSLRTRTTDTQPCEITGSKSRELRTKLVRLKSENEDLQNTEIAGNIHDVTVDGRESVPRKDCMEERKGQTADSSDDLSSICSASEHSTEDRQHSTLVELELVSRNCVNGSSESSVSKLADESCMTNGSLRLDHEKYTNKKRKCT